MTLTEQRLVRIWSRTAATHGKAARWLDLNSILHEISVVLDGAGAYDAGQMFHDSASLALRRYVDEVTERAERVQAAA